MPRELRPCSARPKNAALEITERHEHKREVEYVKLGDDATVKYGELDFKFKISPKPLGQ